MAKHSIVGIGFAAPMSSTVLALVGSPDNLGVTRAG